MKKYIITILTFFAALNCISQTVQVNQKDSTVFKSTSRPSAAVRVIGSVTPDSLNVPTFDTANVHARYTGSTTFLNEFLYTWDGSKWVSVGGGGTIAGGAFTTSNIDIGYNPGTNLTAEQLIQKVWYGLQPPTATLTGGTTLELSSAATTSETLNWSGGRGSNTPTLTTIVITGSSQTYNQSFSQPSQSGSVSGTQAVDVPTNVEGTTVFTNTVTASDGQVATATSTYTKIGKKYYGLVSDTTGIGSGTQDASILWLTSAFATAKSLTTSIVPSGTQFFVYVFPASLGSLSSITFNGFSSLDAMNTTTRTFTNALGYSQSYIYYWNKLGQTSSSSIIAQ